MTHINCTRNDTFQRHIVGARGSRLQLAPHTSVRGVTARRSAAVHCTHYMDKVAVQGFLWPHGQQE